ncbi:MAG: DNA polymerase III subunit delta [Eubacteriales bacterium]|nr:DNA polymerase III subunit delta [Eubacteriales bacterium]MDD3867414.1 DNA polymerase III subunit delta [Eubacteriales bacterium]
MARTRKNAALDYQALRTQLRDGRYESLYVIYGDERFLIEKLISAFDQQLIEPGSRELDRVVLHGDGQPGRIEFERLRAEVQTPPFLSRRKLVIVRDSGWFSTGRKRANSADDADDEDSGGTAQDRQSRLIELFSQLSDSVCLVMIEEKVDRRLRQLISAIEQHGVLAEISRQTPALLQTWVEAECRSRELKLAPGTAESLIDRCDGDMAVLWQELSKLFLHCGYTREKTISPQLIADLSLPDLRGSVFDLTDAMATGRTEQALRLLDTLIGQKQPVQLISFMLARHIRQLICAAELKRPDQIASTLKVMPFVARRLGQQANGLSLPLLEALYRRCYETDLQVKTGQIQERLGLEILIIMACETNRWQLRQ